VTEVAGRGERAAVDLRWPGMVLAALVGGAVLGGFSMLGDGIVRVRLVTILANLGSPWALAAFGIGLTTTGRARGAAGGTLLLLAGSVTYAMRGFLHGYGIGPTTLQWAAVAFVAGPVMGWCGAAVARGRPRPPLLALAGPSVILVAEAVFFLWERRVWRWHLVAEPYRLADLGVALGFVALAAVLPVLLGEGRPRVLRVHALAAGAGSVAAAGFLAVYRWMLLS
jgi:hypothetical protein